MCIQILHEKDFEFNCDHCGKNFTKVFNLEICIQTLHESHKTLDWILKITAVYKYKKFNCDQCGKYFARWCNLKVHLQNVHENSWIELWILANISPKHSICGKSFTKSQRNYDCDSCRKLSTQLENLNKHIMGIHARQRNYKCVSCGKYITKSASLMIHIKIIHQGQRNHKCDYCGKFYTQMTNLKIHFKMFHEEQKNF